MKLRELPSVDALLRDARLAAVPHALAVPAARAALARAREEIHAGVDPGDLVERTLAELAASEEPRLRRVLNATGVILHTNLGRAPLAGAALERVREVGAGYSNLEYDLAEGSRGSRQDHVAATLRRLTGAEAALVVNNNAGAVLLALAALAEGREVLVSRGELIEIGDGFRIPDVLARSGARLVEVGTTNRTRVADYERALTDASALVLRVHQSNFRVVGFGERPQLPALARLAARNGLPLVDDLGSGALLPSNSLLLGDEPTAAQSIEAGADLVCFSGDKLLGGPQAGIVVGRAELVERLRRHPLQRALRADKLTVAALEGTLGLYLDPERALREIPVLAMLAEPADAVRARAERLAGLVDGTVEETIGRVGGGALPLVELPSSAVAVAEALAAPLRLGDTPVVGIVRDGRLLLDCRTLADAEVEEVAAAVNLLQGKNLMPRPARASQPSTAPRGNRDGNELLRKAQLRWDPHIAPLTDFVEALRRERNEPDIPWFDPTEAGVHARILALLESPGRRASTSSGSGFISADNDDPTAANMWQLLREAGIDRATEYAAWNVVPWYLGDAVRGRNASAYDIAEARSALLRVLPLFQDIRVILLLGDAAARAWSEAEIATKAMVIRAPHPSPQSLNTRPARREALSAALREAHRIARSSPA